MQSLFNGRFLEACNIVLGSTTVNDDANDDITGDRINMRDYEGVAIVILKPAGTAGDDLSVDLNQHTAASSGSSKALSAIRDLWFNLGATTLAAASGWVYATITETDAVVTDVLVGGVVRKSRNANFVVGDAVVDITADSNDAIIVFDVKSSDMDGGGGYNWLSLDSEGDAVGNALVLNILYIPYGRKNSDLAPISNIA